MGMAGQNAHVHIYCKDMFDRMYMLNQNLPHNLKHTDYLNELMCNRSLDYLVKQKEPV